MTDFADLKSSIADWANRQDWTDALVTNFIRQCEQKLNAELRIDRMIVTSTGNIANRCASLPNDWLEMDLVSIENVSQWTPNGWRPIRYKPRDEFFRMADDCAFGHYTIVGRNIFFGGAPNATEGINFQISYYAEVPVLTDANQSWVYTKYPSLYLYGSLMHADLHAVGEEQNAANMKSLVDDMVGKLNADHLRAKASGSRLTRSRVRSFG